MSFISSGFDQSSIFNTSFNLFSFRGVSPELSDLLEAATRLFDAADDYSNRIARFRGGEEFFGATDCACVRAPVSLPDPADSGSLKTEGDMITTPGGYKIELIGQHEWKITGPDGKETRIWGDPHVAEGDGGKWDFKRSSTFVLGDGTRMNVTTVPGGHEGMTVTGSLEIINGNDRVLVTDIDKGKGKIGTITQDGYQHVNSFQGDVFVMGREADDWSYTGREITGSENGGESFKLGGELHPPENEQPDPSDEPFNWIMSLLNEFINGWQNLPSSQPTNGTNPFADTTNNEDQPEYWNDTRQDSGRNLERIAEAFRAFAQLFRALARILSMSEQFNNGRFNNRLLTA
jgi:hypothetical protein